MIIGVPKEIKLQEHRIGLTPDSVKALTDKNHEVLIEDNGGFEAGFENEQYTSVGAKIANTAADIFNDAEIIVKVKEPQKVEVDMIRENQIVYTYLHLAAAKELTEGLIKSKSINIAYETVTAEDGSMPLLAPMSAIAGQLSVIVGSYHLLKPNQGMGTLIGAFADIQPRIVTVIGAGIAGTEAIDKAISNKAYLKIIDLSEKRLNELEAIYGNKNVEYILSTESAINEAIKDSDLVVATHGRSFWILDDITPLRGLKQPSETVKSVSYTHLRAHET